MSTLLRTLQVILLLMVCTVIKAEVTVQNNAYHNLLVSFSPSVSPENRKSLLDNVQLTLSETSSVLHKAVGLRIASVTILLPESWDVSEWEDVKPEAASLSLSSTVPDVLVDGMTNSAFGKHPFALQYGGCGVPGRQITLLEEFLMQNDTFPKGKLLAREWLKYRYGVFDENGFPNDPLYPLYYRITGREPSDIKITDCTDHQVEYYYRDSKGNNCTLETTAKNQAECHIHPDEDSITNVTSSLMYFQKEIKHMEQVCGKTDHPHNNISPNKQNILCSEKSIWDVLSLSSDFKSVEGNDFEEIQFSYVQRSRPRVVISWQNTHDLKEKGNMIKKAIGKLLYDLPDGSKCALFNYVETPSVVLPLTDLNNWPSDRNIPLESDFASTDEPCSTCAVTEAVNVLLGDNDQMKGSVIIIAASSQTGNEELLEKLKNSQLCLHIIVFTNPKVTKDGFEKLLSASPCSTFQELTGTEDEKTTFEILYKAMATVLPRSTENTIITTVDTKYLSYEDGTEIAADNTLAKVILWLAKSIEGKSIICKAGENEVSLYQEVKTQEFVAFSFVPEDKTVKCSLKFPTLDPVLTQVQVTSKPGEYFEDNLWITNPTDPKDKQQMPVIIYAQLKFGENPIRNAVVKANVVTPNGEQGDLFDLFDDGRGDPDITMNDGIYSRYFTGFTGVGEYSVTITATDNGGQARVGKNGFEHCCGSQVNSDVFKLNPFERVFKTTFWAVSERPKEGYKPSRITDLRVDKADLPESINLKWTAPGGEADKGSATLYTIKLFTARDDAFQNFEKDATKEFNITLTPQIHGSPESISVELSENLQDNTTYYIAMRAKNEHHFSETSNVVEIFITEHIEVSTSDDTTTEVPKKDRKEASPDKKTIGIIVGVIVAVIVIIICAYLAVYFFVIKPKREEAEKAAKKSDANHVNINSAVENNVLNPLHSIPADVLLNHHKEVVNAKNEHKDPPIFKEENVAQNSAPSELSNAHRSDKPEYSQIQMEQQDSEAPQQGAPKRTTFV